MKRASEHSVESSKDKKPREPKEPKFDVREKYQFRKERAPQLKACIEAINKDPPAHTYKQDPCMTLEAAYKLRLNEAMVLLQRQRQDCLKDQTKKNREDEELNDLWKIGTALAGHPFQSSLFEVLLSKIDLAARSLLIAQILRALVRMGEKEKLESMCKEFEYSVKYIDTAGQHLLHYAASKGHVEILKYLLDKHFTSDDLQVQETFWDYNPLQLSIADGVYGQVVEGNDPDMRCVHLLVNRSDDKKSNCKALRKVVLDMRNGFGVDGILVASLVEKEFRHLIEPKRKRLFLDTQETESAAIHDLEMDIE